MFEDRVDAGRQLAARLEYLRGQDVVVLGLPRGGVPVAYEVAQSLGKQLDVIVVRKLGVPYQPEVAMGALGEDGVRVLEPRILAQARVRDEDLQQVEERERGILDTRVERFRRGRPRVPLQGRTALIVDDGVATGSTARAACQVARQLGAAKVILAVPVAPKEAARELQGPDEIVCLRTPAHFTAVGVHYEDFSPTTDDEVVVLLDAAAKRAADGDRAGNAADFDGDVEIPVGGRSIAGHLYLPKPADAVVLFAHGSGSSRFSPRNRYVARVLEQAGLGTLLLDLLTPEEELDRANVFDIGLLAGRLAEATRWVLDRPDAAGCRIGYFGASTGAAAALWAAAEPGAEVAAVVSRGGRPDLAGDRLPAVTAPTLLIVGGADTYVLELNHQARGKLHCESELAVVPGATHLFEEHGTLAEAAARARDWFVRHLRTPAPDVG
ncbi:dienelactone hydrolase family protein [Arthrobacter sp. I2-34]|uniref:Dienelactone hydrolase family protein n=1 Tax=Arthrobacter hankyongi TaxID=2904801 RepID=A0ABS9L3C9_9MICC|nr:phosphoribosyltransferase family protein [Arthrobacter hankyongi]MCG2621199.1 dienelactone hydrolase family protein [Arthrobacter hankyongi]